MSKDFAAITDSASDFSLTLNYLTQDHNAVQHPPPYRAAFKGVNPLTLMMIFPVSTGDAHHSPQAGSGRGRRLEFTQGRAIAALGDIVALMPGARALQRLVAIGEATELADHLAMRAGMQQIVGAGLGHPLADQPHAAVLIAQVLRMHQRQVIELPRRLVDAHIPFAVDRRLGHGQPDPVGGKGTPLAAEHVARELVGEDDISQRATRIGQPKSMGALTGAAPCVFEPVPDRLIQRFGRVVPALRPNLVQPETQYFLGRYHRVLLVAADGLNLMLQKR